MKNRIECVHILQNEYSSNPCMDYLYGSSTINEFINMFEVSIQQYIKLSELTFDHIGDTYLIFTTAERYIKVTVYDICYPKDCLNILYPKIKTCFVTSEVKYYVTIYLRLSKTEKQIGDASIWCIQHSLLKRGYNMFDDSPDRFMLNSQKDCWMLVDLSNLYRK